MTSSIGRMLAVFASSSLCCALVAGCSADQNSEPASSDVVRNSPSVVDVQGAPTLSSSVPTSTQFPSRSQISGIVAGHHQGDDEPYEIVVIDPSTGEHQVLGEFPPVDNLPQYSFETRLSPDFTKIATSKRIDSVLHAGWYDMAGQYTDLTPGLSADEFGSNTEAQIVGFDAKGLIYWQIKESSVPPEGGERISYTVYRADPSDPVGTRETVPTQSAVVGAPTAFQIYRAMDGSLTWDKSCRGSVYSTMAPDTYFGVEGHSTLRAHITGTQIYRGQISKLTTSMMSCTLKDGGIPLLPSSSSLEVTQPVPNPDGSKVAFLTTNGTLYTVDGYGRERPIQIGTGFQNFALLEWL